MAQILIYFFMAISLSMDAFTLAFSIGTTSPQKKEMIRLISYIGLFHLMMPILGNKLGLLLKNRIYQKSHFITSLIFLILMIEMILEKDSNEKIVIKSKIMILFIALTVSIDSFFAGIALGLSKEYIIVPSIIFSIISSSFTWLGLILGKKLEKKYKERGTYIGIILMFIIFLKYFLNI